MKLRKFLSLVLALAMLVSAVPIAAFATETDSEPSGEPEVPAVVNPDNLFLDKTAALEDDGTYTINLEAYATGNTITKTITEGVPLDVVLVMDQSGSLVSDGEDRLTTLKSSVNAFLESLRANGEAYNVNHRVAICGFASHSKQNNSGLAADGYSYANDTRDNAWTNTGIFVDGEFRDYGTVEYTEITKAANISTSNTYTIRGKSADKDVYEYTTVRYSSSNDAWYMTVNGNVVAPSSYYYTASAVLLSKYSVYTVGNSVNQLTDADYSAAWENVADGENGQGSINPDITSAVNHLSSNGATATFMGMKMARKMLENLPAEADGTPRKKIVIVFTDGEPGPNGYAMGDAHAALSEAGRIKEDGTEIFTIGIYSAASATTVETFMNWMSSNYEDLTYTDTPIKLTTDLFAVDSTASSSGYVGYSANGKVYYYRGIDGKNYGLTHYFIQEDGNYWPVCMRYEVSTGGYYAHYITDDGEFSVPSPNEAKYYRLNTITPKSEDYYKHASNISELSGIFETISSEMTGFTSELSLDADAVLKDVLADGFTLTDNTTITVSVVPGSVSGETITWGTAQKVLTFNYADATKGSGKVKVTGAADQTEMTLTAAVTADGTVTVTGFNYAKAEDANQINAQYISESHPGSKLVVSITGVEAAADVVTDSVITTNAQTSGIYEGPDEDADEDGETGEIQAVFPMPTTYLSSKTYYLDSTGKITIDPKDFLMTVEGVNADIDGYHYFGTPGTTVETEYGKITVNADGTITYELINTAWEHNDIFYLFGTTEDPTVTGATANANSNMWSKIIIVPPADICGNLYVDKTVEATSDPNEFVLTLEAFAQGSQETVTLTKPADIVLVLDHSGSMRTPAGASKVLHSQIYDGDSLKQAGEPYDGTAAALTKDKLDSTKGQHTGYYVAWSTSSSTWFVLRYDAEKTLWYGYSVPSTESIVNTQYRGLNDPESVGPAGWTEHTMTQSWTYEGLPPQLLYYKSQYAMLYDAVNTFTTQLRASGAEHRVAIVGFAGPDSNGAGVYVNGYVDGTYEGFKYYKNLANNLNTERLNKLYREAFKNVQHDTDYSELLSAIEAIETNHSFTCPAAGLDLATDIYTANEVDPTIRDRIVVLFTDGIPNRMTSNATDSTDAQIFNEIVEYAYAAKQQGATIYSISTTTLEAGKDRTFLHYASSDYPNAVDFDNPGSPIENQVYTKRVENLDDFSTMFDSVTNNISSTTVTLDETAVLKEVLTDYFVLNPNTDVDVEIYTAAHNGDGTFAEPVLRTEAEGFTYALSSSEGTDRMDTIQVTGFDYADEYVSNIPRTVNGEDYYGSKLVVKVKIRTREGFWGGNNVPTNEESTGIYDRNSFPVEDFPEPEVNVPIVVDVNAKDKTIYYDGDVTAKDLIDSVTVGGEKVTVNDNGTLTPKEDWMNDYADLKWTDSSTKPGDTPDNHTPKDYTFEVQATPKYDGTENRQEDPGNIAGNIDGGTVEDTPSAETAKTGSDTGHVFILIPELTFKDSTTAFGTPTDGYDYTGKDYVDTDWVFMEDTKDTTNAPAASGTAPELELTYTPSDEDVQDGSFVTDTKVDVTVAIKKSGGDDLDITGITSFDWQDCKHDVANIEPHKGNVNSNEFWVHVALDIVPDTVVIDYGLDVVIDVLANDYRSEYVQPALTGIRAMNTANFSDADVAYSDGFGTLKMEKDAQGNNVKVRYVLNTSNGMQMNQEEVFEYQATYTVGKKSASLSETVTVIPATTIYYEDNFVQFTVFDMNGDVIANDWSSDGTQTDADQAQDRPGAYSSPNVDANNIYGYDGAYTTMAAHSLNSAKMVTANSEQFAEAQFTFQGTGFDVISLTSNTSGTVTVSVYKTSEFVGENGNNYAATPVETHMVDTYYGYQYVLREVTYEWDVTPDHPKGHWVSINVVEPEERATAENTEFPANPKDGDRFTRVENTWIVDPSAENALYQVPVMKVSGLEYGQYTALITVWYEQSLDHQNHGQYDFYLDAIRIYDPANDGITGKDAQGNNIYNDVIKDAYVADGEGWPEYFELRNLIINAETFDSLGDDSVNGIVFIDNTKTNGAEYSIEDYTNFGPNNELYLAPGQSVAFNLSVTDPALARIHLAMKSVGSTANVNVYDAADTTHTSVTPTTINTATDLYYDITKLNGKTVVISNTDQSGDAILSITNVKVTYTSEHADGIEAGYFTTTQTVANDAVKSLMRMSTPDVSESVAVNETTGAEYATLTEALNAAQEGDTIKLLQDQQAAQIMVYSGVTLDLNGFELTADYMVAFDDADIIDSDGSGKLLVSAKNIVLDEANAMIPVYDGDGYIFTKAGFSIKQDTSYTGEGIKINALAYPVNMEVVNLLKDGAADNQLQVVIELTWETDQGTGSQQFVFTDEVVASVYGSNGGNWASYSKMFSMVITGIENVRNLNAGIMLVSGTDVSVGSTMNP